jgi:hypothetical protein
LSSIPRSGCLLQALNGRPERRRIKTSKHFKEVRFETVEAIDRQYDKDLVELK